MAEVSHCLLLLSGKHDSAVHEQGESLLRIFWYDIVLQFSLPANTSSHVLETLPRSSQVTE